MMPRTRLFSVIALAAALAGCGREGELVVNQGVGITAVLDSCPSVGIPDYTGDVTLFRQAGDVSAANLDMVASITNLRHACNEQGERIYSSASFDVLARRLDTRGARTVTLPYYATVMRGGTAVVSKRLGSVTLNFADGQERAQTSAQAGAFVNRAEASLPADIREKITRRRRAGDPDAALDPLADPEVRAAIQRTSFELLVGFQLTQEQLAYNATR
ncbi:hypothetical protein [Altererythrobacter lutimaris]|uniref:Uncharacterized protein n=1 Tax=Altererythrobacter lutimaris TaxID=2743979 RepID=A0A850H6F6_9SPHN|nr:hypothetical protein [Altererythrobacter lutimaris]NVE94737.1 hypothetical protein [Altererythrobacter lutimaris]